MNFDDIVRDVRNEKVEDSVVEAAAERVHARVFGHGAISASAHIRSCADFRALIPDYLGGRLTESRKLLFEDHVHECVDCRRALAEAKAPAGKVVRMERRPSMWSKPGVRWAVAAMLLIGVGAASVTLLPNLVPVGGVHATIATVDGSLYGVSENGLQPVSVGREIGENEPVRTAKASYAVLRLTDGSQIEMNERAQVSVSRSWRGTTIRLDRGNIIVQAAKQKRGRLYVATGDATVSVKGTVFAVSRGTKGSRVSVVEGVVEVAAASGTQTLTRGDQTTTDPNLLKTTVEDEVAWSRNKAHYLALLGEFATLEKKIQALPGPGLRYSSKLAAGLPADTTLYVAIPNMGSTLAEAERLIEEQAQTSPVLREWWEKRAANGFDKAVSELKGLSDYVGDEIVVGFTGSMDRGPHTPIVLAEVRRPGLKAYLDTRIATMGVNSAHHPLIANSMADLGARRSTSEPMIYAGDDMFVMAGDGATMQRALARQGGFTSTPFWNRISQAYQAGAGWVIALNMEQIPGVSVQDRQKADKLGITDARYLVIERKDIGGGKAENRAVVNFAGQRRGVASWLGAPGPMGSLDFVSPEASVVTSFVIKNPAAMLDEMLAMADNDPKAAQALADFQAKTGVDIKNDIAASLGSEITIAVDGPVLPIPSWKLAVEVYSPDRLQMSIQKLVDAFNQQAPENAGKITLTSSESNGRTYYALSSTKSPISAYYTYVDSYLLAGSSTALLDQSIRNRQAGFTLSKSATFRSLLPRDGYANFSGLVFYNAANTLGPLIDQVRQAATPDEQKSISALTANSAPTLIYAYGEPDRITLASSGSFFGMNIGTLMGAPGEHGMFLPQVFGQAFGHRGPHQRSNTQ